jgi:hypothetical protein
MGQPARPPAHPPQRGTYLHHGWELLDGLDWLGHARGHPARPAGSGQPRPLAGWLGRPSQPGRPPSCQVI